MLNRMTFQSIFCLIVFTVEIVQVLAPVPALASDWGYDEAGNMPSTIEVVPMRAVAQPFAGSKSAAVKPVNNGAQPLNSKVLPAKGAGKNVNAKALPVVPANKRSARAGTASTPRVTLLQECWANVYELAADRKLNADERGQLNAIVNGKLGKGGVQADECNAATVFWPRLADYLLAHPEQKENYGLLLHALLRRRARNQNASLADGASDALAGEESALVAQMLGPVRLSVSGVVPFSEDALNAYTDMACFVYEQQHPGKSVDAADNRDLFGMIIAKKFKDAPSKRDQEAMSGFDLEWAKFKIVWAGADKSQRAALLQKLVGAGAAAAWMQVPDPVLDSVLTSWPGTRSSTASSAAVNPNK